LADALERKTNWRRFLAVAAIVLVVVAGGIGYYVTQTPPAPPATPTTAIMPTTPTISRTTTVTTQPPSLSRSYPKVIKQVLLIAGRGTTDAELDAYLERMKETGFNTVGINLPLEIRDNKYFPRMGGGGFDMLLKNIAKWKSKGWAVCVHYQYYERPPTDPECRIVSPYAAFRQAFLDLIRTTAAKFEEYKVEYVAIHNELESILKTHGWSKEEYDKNLIEFYPLFASTTREHFSGKIIGKMHPVEFLELGTDASNAFFTGIDIAAIDISLPRGPGPAEDPKRLERWGSETRDLLRRFAAKAKERNVPWMVGEYGVPPSLGNEFVKQNQVKLAQIAFDAYLENVPRGAGFTLNDHLNMPNMGDPSFFMWTPNGEATRQAFKSFLGQLDKLAS